MSTEISSQWIFCGYIGSCAAYRVCGKSHKLLFGICSCVNDLSRRLTMNCIMNFVLDFLEKLNRNLRMGIIPTPPSVWRRCFPG